MNGHLNKEEFFWRANIEQLKKGYIFSETDRSNVCILCGCKYEEGIIYQFDSQFFDFNKAAEKHVKIEHCSMFDYLISMDKKYTGLTENQKQLLRMFYEGHSDKETAKTIDSGNASTIRNYRFSFREKHKQAKIYAAIMELVEESRELLNRNAGEEFVPIHRNATMIDERYAITSDEREITLKRYFDSDNNLLVKEFPAKEKKKIIILQHLAKEFEPDKKYSEKDVNDIIRKFYDDVVSIRRFFINYGFLDRTTDGREYWVK